MKHRIGFNRLSRKASHRKALIKNMVTSLLKYERITTTKAKALAIRTVAEKMITRAKEDSVHNRRMIGRKITDEAILAKLFTVLAPRSASRPGGYTRILKLGPRPTDAAEMVILELVDRVTDDSAADEKAAKKAAKTQKAKDDAKSESADASSAKKAPAKKASAKASDGAAAPKTVRRKAGSS